jgi:hypothetical protein
MGPQNPRGMPYISFVSFMAEVQIREVDTNPLLGIISELIKA